MASSLREACGKQFVLACRGFCPLVDDIVVFSHENNKYFTSRSRFRGSRVHLLPNHVGETPQNPRRVAGLRALAPVGSAVFLRISHIDRTYETTAEQAINLVMRLRRDNFPAFFLGIGVVSESGVCDRLHALLGDSGRLLVSPDYTLNASEAIGAGDFVIGTGRSLMGAAARGRVLLAPVSGPSIPVLVTPGNWEDLHRANFSPRGTLPGLDERENYAMIQTVLASPERRAEFQAFSRALYEEHFALAGAVGKYLSIYRDLEPRRTRAGDHFLHWLWLLKAA